MIYSNTRNAKVYIVVKNSGNRVMLKDSPVFFSPKRFSSQKSKCFIGVCDKRIKPGYYLTRIPGKTTGVALSRY